MSGRSNELGRKLRAAIGYSGRDQKDIAADSGIAKRTFGYWVKEGVPHKRDPDILHKLAEACGVTPYWFSADFERLGLVPVTSSRSEAELSFLRLAGEEGRRLYELPERRHGTGRRADDGR